MSVYGKMFTGSFLCYYMHAIFDNEGLTTGSLSYTVGGTRTFNYQKEYLSFTSYYDGSNGSLFISILLHNSEF